MSDVAFGLERSMNDCDRADSLGGIFTITDSDNLEQGVRFGDLSLAGDTQDGEEDNHRTTACGEPEWAGHPVDISY